MLAVCHGIILIKQILITTWHSVTNAPAGFTGNVPKFQMKSLRNKQAGFAAYALFLTVSCITIHRKNFRFPYWEIPVIFPKFGKKLGKNWENISQMWENFGTLYSLLVPIEGLFGKKRQ